MEFNFRFDPANFIVGVFSGWASAFALYQARQLLSDIRSSVSQRAETAQQYASRSAEGRYVHHLIRFAEANHLMGKQIELSKVLVEPRFITAAALAAPRDDEDDAHRDPFRVVPRIHDLPYLHAPYNISTASLDELSQGERALALLGLPGSGRTTALQAIALWSLNVVDFKPPKDRVQQMIEEEEQALKADVRAARIKEYLALEERAREKLAEEQSKGGANDSAGGGLSAFKRLLPMYVHLANVDLMNIGKTADPAEPFIRALQTHVGKRSVAGRTLPRKFYERLNQGTALVLIDGFDNLPEDDQPSMLAWLRAFIREYRKNFIIVAGSVMRSGGLLKAGLTPVYLRPFNELMIDSLAEKWAAHWSRLSGTRRSERPNDGMMGDVKRKSRGLSVFDIALRTRSVYAEEITPDAQPQDWLQGYLRALGMSDALLGQAAHAAALQLSEGYITASRLHDIALGRPAPVKAKLPAKTKPADAESLFAPDDDEEVNAIFERGTAEEDINGFFDTDAQMALNRPANKPKSGGTSTPNPPLNIPNAAPDDKKADLEAAKTQARLLQDLERMGLIQRYHDNRYQFKSAIIAAYLASLTLQTAHQTLLESKVHQAAWGLALAYAAGHTPFDTLVQTRLKATPDLLISQLTTLATWMVYAPAKAAWRTDVIRALGNLFLAQSQYPLTRERAAAALACTRDKNALVVMQRGLKHPNVVVRCLACLATGVLQGESAVDALNTLTRDPDPEVGLAATLGIGAIGTDKALETLALVLAEGAEPLQRAAAEMFAAIPDEGYPVLYDAVRSEEITLRRAAVFGLRRVPTSWSLITMYRALLEDEQWYVQSAAAEAFSDLRGDSRVPRAYPSVNAIPWLRDEIEALAQDTQSRQSLMPPDQILLNLLHQGSADLQAVAAWAMGQLGMADKADELYATLLHDHEQVRLAAHRGLGELQIQMGKALPAPVG